MSPVLPAIANRLPEGFALGDAVNAITLKMRQLGAPLSLQGSFQGTAQAFQQSQAGLLFLLVVAVLLTAARLSLGW